MKSFYNANRKKWKIRNRLMVIFYMIVLLSVTACTITLSWYWAENKVNIFDEYSNEITKQVSKSLDAYLDNLDRLAISVAYSTDIQNALSSDYQKRPELLSPNERQAGWYLSSQRDAFNGVESIFVYDMFGHEFSSPVPFVNLDFDLADYEWMKTFAASEESSRVIGPYINEQVSHSDDELVSIVRKVKKLDTMDKIGYVLVNVKIEDMLTTNLQNIWEADRGSLLIVAPDNHIVYDSGKIFENKASMDSQWFNKLRQSHWRFEYKYQNVLERIVFTQSETSGWYVMRIAEQQQIYAGIKKMVVISITIALLIILIMTFPMLIFSNSFVKPIIRIQKSMVRMETDNFDPFCAYEEIEETIVSKHTDQDEITSLAESFNHMSLKLYSMILKIYNSEEERHRLEMEALSAQINPHFTYNTLGTIKQMALLQNAHGIAEMVDAIVNLLRVTAKYGDGTSLVSTEIRLLQDYIYIMQMRYFDSFNFTVSVADETQNLPILSMLFQPIVENAILHGTYGLDRLGMIHVSTHVDNSRLYITIEDNGNGYNEEKIGRLLSGSVEEDHNRESIGVYNVHKRIQLNYGTEYGLSFQHRSPYGTIVTIVVPAQEKEGVKRV